MQEARALQLGLQLLPHKVFDFVFCFMGFLVRFKFYIILTPAYVQHLQ